MEKEGKREEENGKRRGGGGKEELKKKNRKIPLSPSLLLPPSISLLFFYIPSSSFIYFSSPLPYLPPTLRMKEGEKGEGSEPRAQEGREKVENQMKFLFSI